MKNILKIVFAASLILLAAFVTNASQNPVAGLLAASVVAIGAEHFVGISLFDFDNMAYSLPLVGLKRKVQTLTIGGAKRLYAIPTADLETEFLNFELAKTAGKFTGAIPLLAGKKFIEIEAWYDTTKFDTEMKAGAGFTQNIEFKTLGYDDMIVKLSALFYENPINLIVQGNDDALYYVGQKYIPIILDMKGVMPEKGTARKEATFTGKQEGMQVPVFPLDPSVTFAVEPLAGAEDPEGGS